jgi:hypothetical protein
MLFGSGLDSDFQWMQATYDQSGCDDENGSEILKPHMEEGSIVYQIIWSDY